MKTHRAALCLGLLASLWFSSAEAAEPRTLRDIEYARVTDKPLLLDLYLPAPTNTALPLLIYVHGGAWRSGTKNDVPILPLLENGYAIASVEYRLTPEAPFPANIHDLKASIRYLRAKAGEHGYDPKRFIIVGSSAGGHLAALVGVSNGHKELEGKVGKFLDQSSDVQAIVSFYGAANLQTILKQSTSRGLEVRVPALQLLLGGQPDEKPDLAKLASPVAQVDKNDPPLLLIHGDKDPQMPIEQSYELQAAYEKLKLPVQFEIIHGGLHGGKEFYDKQRMDLVDQFLKKHLR
ncbi:MAG: nlhH 5 [Verrucomicrobia bacterium]|jgi:acetyl esterase/lipase|nr:nlhH 5 [Verrucomicrobiota bacterium]